MTFVLTGISALCWVGVIEKIRESSQLLGVSSTYSWRFQLSNEKNPSCLGHIGDYSTQVHSYMNLGMIMNDYKDPY